MVENEINDLTSETLSESGISLLHLNCRSLLGNFDKFRALTMNLLNSFSVVGISETWLNDETSDLVNLPGYNFISNHRLSKSGGGVGLNQNLLPFMEDFNKILSIISKDNKQCFIMGDFNLDLFHYDQHAFTQEFMDSLFSHVYSPH